MGQSGGREVKCCDGMHRLHRPHDSEIFFFSDLCSVFCDLLFFTSLWTGSTEVPSGSCANSYTCSQVEEKHVPMETVNSSFFQLLFYRFSSSIHIWSCPMTTWMYIFFSLNFFQWNIGNVRWMESRNWFPICHHISIIFLAFSKLKGIKKSFARENSSS